MAQLAIGIFGDYKQIISKVAYYDKCPILKTEDLFATLNEGKFSKLDLNHTYQQLMLAPTAKKLITINTQ